MPLSLGTNCGFVTVAPTADPTGTGTIFDARCRAMKVTAPDGSSRIIEMGGYVDNPTEAADMDLGNYSDAGAGEPEVRQNFGTIAKGTGAGWKTLTGINYLITAGTVYWLGAQCDDTTTTTNLDAANTGGPGSAFKGATQTALPADWGASTSTDVDGMEAIYAVWRGDMTLARSSLGNRSMLLGRLHR